jgi:hypothetical protein
VLSTALLLVVTSASGHVDARDRTAMIVGAAVLAVTASPPRASPRVLIARRVESGDRAGPFAPGSFSSAKP